MSLLQHFADEAEHVLDIVKKSIKHEVQSFGAAHPTTEALLKTLEAHLEPTPVVAPATAPAVKADPVAQATSEQNVA